MPGVSDQRCTWPGPRPSQGHPPSARNRRCYAWARSRSWLETIGGERSGMLHRLDDFHIAGAAADVAAERLADVVIGWIRVAPEQIRGCHPGTCVADTA